MFCYRFRHCGFPSPAEEASTRRGPSFVQKNSCFLPVSSDKKQLLTGHGPSYFLLRAAGFWRRDTGIWSLTTAGPSGNGTTGGKKSSNGTNKKEAWYNQASQLTGAVGIEPTSMVLETTVLPLNYAPTTGSHRTDELYYSIAGRGKASPFCIIFCRIMTGASELFTGISIHRAVDKIYVIFKKISIENLTLIVK